MSSQFFETELNVKHLIDDAHFVADESLACLVWWEAWQAIAEQSKLIELRLCGELGKFVATRPKISSLFAKG